GLLGLTASIGSLSWLVSLLRARGIMLTTRTPAAAAAALGLRAGFFFRRAPEAGDRFLAMGALWGRSSRVGPRKSQLSAASASPAATAASGWWSAGWKSAGFRQV